MDSGMSAAEMELRAVSKALPAAVPSEASSQLQVPNISGTDTGSAAKRAQTAQAGNAVGQMQSSAAPLQQSDLLQKDVQQQKPSSDADKRTDQPLPAPRKLAEVMSQEGEHVADNVHVLASAVIAEAASEAGSAVEAIPAAGAQSQSIGGSKAPNSETSMSGSSQQSPRSILGMDEQSDAVKVNKQTPGLQLHIHADSSGGSKVGPQPADSSLKSTPVQKAAEDSNALVVNKTAAALDSMVQMGVCSPATEITPAQGAMTHPAVEKLPEGTKASDTDKSLSSIASSAELGKVNGSAALVTGSRQAECAVSAAASSQVQRTANATQASSSQQGTVVESWAVDEGDFAVMLKDFLVRLLRELSCQVLICLMLQEHLRLPLPPNWFQACTHSCSNA